MKETPDWDALIQKHLDGQTTEEEAELLSAHIVEDAEVRSLYLKAAQVHGALADEALALDLEAESVQPEVVVRPPRTAWKLSWPRQVAAGLVAGLFVGLLGTGIVWAVNTPKSQARALPVANGDFEASVQAVDIGFPEKFGNWSGDPAEVVEGEEGNRVLRFLETANVTGKPNGGASACNVFQLIDLSSLRQQWDLEDPDIQTTLQLSAKFHRKTAPNDAEFPKLKASCGIHLYQAEPDSIGKAWPDVIREAVSVGNKVIRLKPGDGPSTISASCILEPEATLALISVNVNTMSGSKTPIPVNGCYVDDVQLTVIQQPKLPVQVVKK